MSGNLGRAFMAFCEAKPDDVALETADGTIRLTRAEYLAFATAAAERLKDRPTGDRIVLALPNGPEFGFWFWACQLLGVVAVPIEPLRAGPRLLHQIDMTRRIAATAGAAAIVSPSGEAATALTVAIPDLAIHSAELEPATASISPTTVSGEDLAFIQFTSGSTGFPKGCALSHANVIANAQACRETFDVQPGDLSYAWMPYHHDMGLMTAMILPVFGRGSIIMDTPRAFVLDPLRWLRLISTRPENVHVSAPNFALALTLKFFERRKPMDLSLDRVQSVICGAEPIDPQLVRRFYTALEPLGLSPNSFFASYGMSETVVLAATQPHGLKTCHADAAALELEGRFIPATPANRSRELICLGRPFRGGDLEIRDGDHALPDRRAGEICLRSTSIMQGYYGSPAATAEVLRDGWLRTGDIGIRIDRELYFVGRRKEIIIVSGQNFDPHDIELQIAEDTGLEARRLCAVNVDVDGKGSSLLIVVEDHPGTAEAELTGTIMDIAFRITGVRPDVTILKGRRLPRTSSGKLQRDAVAAWHRTGEPVNETTGAKRL